MSVSFSRRSLTYRPAFAWFCLFALVWTGILLFAGGFTTSIQAGMAFLDWPAAVTPNGTTVVLLHGKNFCAATWGETARGLAAAGYRVIAPDQIGFCKSSKPSGYQYSFHTMAALTAALLDRAGAGKVVLVGHSTGGILATRFALRSIGEAEWRDREVVRW